MVLGLLGIDMVLTAPKDIQEKNYLLLKAMVGGKLNMRQWCCSCPFLNMSKVAKLRKKVLMGSVNVDTVNSTDIVAVEGCIMNLQLKSKD
jgi:hypothetical protein